MKKQMRFFMLATLGLSISGGVHAQENFQCFGYEAAPQQVTKMSQPCTTNTMKYIPDAYTYRKTVKVNIHFMCKSESEPLNFTATDDGLGNTSITGYSFAQNIVSYTNSLLGSNVQMALPPGNNTPVLPISYRFSLEGVYFHYDSNGYTYQSQNGSSWTYAVNPSSEINLFYYYDAGAYVDAAGTAHYSMGGAAGGANVNIVGAWQAYFYQNPNYEWASAGLLKHEVSHCLSLLHSVHNGNGSCASQGFTDYCSDTPDRWDLINGGYGDPCCGSSGSGPQCTNNFMDYTGGVAMTPEQLGRVDFHLMNYKFAYIKQDYCTKEPGASYVIGNNSDLVWENSRIINRDLIIEGGSRLTVKCRLYMSSDAKVIVKPGGRLILDGGELTGACNQFWSGVEVWGTTSQNQYPQLNPTYQGYIELKNGAIIENARDAIRLWNPNDWNAIGGVVVCNGAVFRNNRRSVEFMAYNNVLNGNTVSNLSSFTNTTFTVNDSYLGSSADFSSHVTLWQVKGVPFRGCTFEDTRANRQFSTTQAKGISSIDASYAVAPYCSVGIPVGQSCPAGNLTNAYIRGFNYGIHATGSSTTQAITVDQVFFDKNVKSIVIESQNNVTVTRSDFTIGQNNATSTGGIHEGIVLSASSGYKIEENTLRKATTPAPGANPVGIRVDNSGTAANRLYKNTVLNLSVGEQVRGQNRNPSSSTQGLQVLCGTHTGNTSHITISTLNVPSNNDGVRTFQGESNLSAGNVFSSTGMHISNTTSWPVTYYHTGGNTAPVNYSTLVYPTLISTANGCASTFGGGLQPPVSGRPAGSDYEKHEQAYNDLLYVYTRLTQENNDEALRQRIRTAWPEEAEKLRDELLARSPYVSTETLKETALRGVLPQGMLLEICLANPEATRGEAFARFLAEELPFPMSGEMVELVRAGWGTATARTELENRMALHAENMALQADQALYTLMEDEVQQPVAIREWLSRRGTLTDLYHLAESYLEEHDYTTAQKVLDDLRNTYGDTEAFREDEYVGYVAYLNLLRQITADGRTIARLNDAEKQGLRALADARTGRVSVMAQNVLCFFYGECRDEAKPAETGTPATAAPGYKPVAVSVQGMPVQVYPNPAREAVYFRWEQTATTNNLHLRISDLTGRTVVDENLIGHTGNWQWDTRLQKAGTYLYELSNDGRSVASGKIIVAP